MRQVSPVVAVVSRGLRARCRFALTLVAAAFGDVALAGAEESPNGDDFQVNSYTTSYQVDPVVAMDGQGNFVVVWQSTGSSGTDDSASSILAQRFAANGTPLGGEFQVNNYTANPQGGAAVAMHGDGSFVVVWGSVGSNGTDDRPGPPSQETSSVQARLYAANGVALGDQFQVNTYTTDGQGGPSVAMDSQGNFVVVWESFGSDGTDTSSYSIHAQRYAANGTPLGGEFQVNTYTTDDQGFPAVAMNGLGDFVVAWTSLGSDDTDTSDGSIHARRYAANGAPLGDEFQVNSYTTDRQQSSSVAMDGQGNFVVAWDSTEATYLLPADHEIRAQRFDANGAELGGEFLVNSLAGVSGFTYTLFPSVATDAQGRFVVAWHNSGSAGTDNKFDSIQARRFDANGIATGPQFQVNTYIGGGQFYSNVASDPQGNFVVAWTSSGSDGTDPGYEISGSSIQARRFDALFRDGFESGLARWTVPAP